MLCQPCQLDSIENEVLAEVEQLKKELSFTMTPRRWFGVLRRMTFARAIRGSNSIEGYNVTIDDAIAAVEQEEPLDPKTEAWVAVNGYRMAMTLVLQKGNDPYFQHSSEFLNALHFMMVGYDLSKNPGCWRLGSIFVHDELRDARVYEGPDVEQVPGLMTDLIASLNSEVSVPAIVKAAMAHLNFVMIHPYSDGNGRMARALQTLVLAREWELANPFFVSIEEYLGRNTREYYDVLEKVGRGSWHPETDTKPWIRFCLKAHYRQATTLKRRGQILQNLFDEIETLVTKLRLPERSISALAEAGMGFRVRNATYRKLADISNGTATRDFRELVNAKLLVATGVKRGRYYTAGAPIVEIATKVGKPHRVSDPFELLRRKQEPMLPGMEALLAADDA